MKKYFLIAASASSVVCVFGLSINLFFYIIYFSDANYGRNLSIAMAFFFIICELYLWAFSDKRNLVAVFLKYSLVAFSIFATMSSQFTSTSQKEQQNAEMVYEKTGAEDDVKYYREQIEKQDDIIDRYVTARAEGMLFTRTDEEFTEAKRLKYQYEAELKSAQSVNRQQVAEVFTTKTIYSWFATDLPEIFRNGLNENLVRVLFQLFSSLLLAMMSPVAISTIRSMNIPVKQENPVSDHPVKLEPEEKPVVKDIETKKPVIQKPVIKKKSIFDKLSEDEVSDILKMMFWPVVQRTGDPMKPEGMVSGFKKVRETQPHVKEYTLKECKMVYDEVIRRGLINRESNKVVMEELRG